jgi:hypothetical protein
MDDRMERRPNWMPWAMASLVMVIVAMLAYAAGQREVASGTGADHWRWAFPNIWGLFLLFWVLGCFRWMFFGWGGGWGYRSWRHRRSSRPFDDEYEDWREWHRREHQKMDGSRPADHVG